MELSEDTERKFLVLSWWLTHVSWRHLGERVRKSVEEILRSIPLKSTLDVGDMDRIFSDLRKKVEYDTIQGIELRRSFSEILLPSDPQTINHVLSSSGIPSELLPSQSPDEQFTMLMAEAQRFIASAEFGNVLQATFDDAFKVLLDYLRRSVFVKEENGIGVSALTTLRLVDVLPGMANWSHLAVHGLPNELVESLSALKELRGFSAVIYSSYEDKLPQ